MSAACKHYADLYGRCIDCGKSWAERKAEQDASRANPNADD